MGKRTLETRVAELIRRRDYDDCYSNEWHRDLAQKILTLLRPTSGPEGRDG